MSPHVKLNEKGRSKGNRVGWRFFFCSMHDKKSKREAWSGTASLFLYIATLSFHDIVSNFNIMLKHRICWHPLGSDNMLFSLNLAPAATTNWTFLQGQLPTFHITAPPSAGSADVAQILTDLSGFLCMIQQNDETKEAAQHRTELELERRACSNI